MKFTADGTGALVDRDSRRVDAVVSGVPGAYAHDLGAKARLTIPAHGHEALAESSLS